MLCGGGKKAILAQSRLEVSIIDKILHAEVISPYRTYYRLDTNDTVYLHSYSYK